MKRLFCVCIGAYAIFSYLVLTFGTSAFTVAVPLLSVAFVSLLILFFIVKKRILGALTLVCLFSLLALFKNNFVDLEKFNTAKELNEEVLTVDGDVKTYNRSEKFTSFTVEDDSLNVPVKVFCHDTDLDIDIGKRASFTGEVTFDADSYNKGEETFLTAFVSDVQVYESDSFLDSLIVKLRSHVRRSQSGEKNQGLMKALIIGDKSDISSDVTEDFKKIGTSHVLAISGLHLSIAVMSLYLFLSHIGVSRYISFSVSMAAAFFYMAVTGFSVSVVRAGQMMIIYFITRMLRRVNDSITALFTAGFLIILNSSWALFSISFRLSFLATLGILVFLPPVSRRLDRMKLKTIQEKGYPNFLTQLRFKLTDYIVISLYSTLSATLFTLPVIILSFNEISLISPIANLTVVFFVKYLLITAFLGSIFSFIPALSALLLSASNLICSLMLAVAHALASVSPAFVGVDIGFVGWGALICVILIFPSLFFSRKMLTLPLTAMAVALALGTFNFAVEKATFTDVRVSTAWRSGCNSLFVSSHGETYFLDITATSSTNVSPIMSLAEKRKITSVDEALVVLTDEFPVERVKLIVDIVNPRKLTLIIAGEFDGEFYLIYEKCRDNNIELNTVFSQNFAVGNNIDFYFYPETCTVFEIKNSANSMTFYKPLSSEEIALYLLDSDIVFFAAKNAPVKDVYKTGDLPESYWRITEKRIIRE